jgi:hypothetical protein
MQIGRAMAQAVSRRPLTAEAWVRSRVSPCRICGGQNGTGTGFPPDYFCFPLSISFHRCSITWKREENWSSFSSSSSQGCTISLKAAVRPKHLLRGPSKKNSYTLMEMVHIITTALKSWRHHKAYCLLVLVPSFPPSEPRQRATL